MFAEMLSLIPACVRGQHAHEAIGADATNDARGALRCRQSNAFQHFTTSARSTGGFERLPGTRPAICRCSRRPKGRSSPRNDLESGECRLTLLGCDSVIVVGTTTSGCVRATVVDAFSLNYRVVLAEEGCFDRSEASHAVSLCDMHAKYADVIPTAEILSYFNQLPANLFDLPTGHRSPGSPIREAAE